MSYILKPRLQNKVAIVIGAGCVGPGWGNGRAIAVRFAQEGAKVFAVDQNPDAMTETADMISEFGGEFTPHVADVTDSKQIAALVGQSTDAVRGKLHRARKNFAALFAQTA